MKDELSKARQKLLANRVLIIILVIALVALPIVVMPDETFRPLGRLGVVLQELAAAALTSAIVGMFFELVTRFETREMFNAAVKESEVRLAGLITGARSDGDDPVNAFWRPFAVDGATIVVAEDEFSSSDSNKSDQVVRVADMMAAIDIYGFLTRLSVQEQRRVAPRIDIVAAPKRAQTDLVPEGHLIVVGAPGANPITSKLLMACKGMRNERQPLKTGYCFLVDPKRTQSYLPGPFVRPAGRNEVVGIADLANGVAATVAPRLYPGDQSGTHQDGALIVHGTTPQSDKSERRVLIFAGHSRRATALAIEFAIKDTAWAESMLKFTHLNSESLLRIQGTGPNHVVKLVDHPRRIAAGQ